MESVPTPAIKPGDSVRLADVTGGATHIVETVWVSEGVTFALLDNGSAHFGRNLTAA